MPPNPPQATVLSIGGGDTLRVRQAGRAITVRLACIDAPEMAQRPHGQRARDYLRTRLPIGARVRLDVKTTDRYGRTVAEVIGDINIGLAMVEDSQAFAYRQYLSGCDAREYLDAGSGPAGGAMASGKCRVASPDHGTSAVHRVGAASRTALPPTAAAIAAARSAPMPGASSCCARAIAVSISS
ncbi:MAG: thermonuclease family protein [Synechococcaceae cyanobacterium]